MRYNRNVLIRLLALWLAFPLAFPLPAVAAENFGGSSLNLPAGLSPEEAEILRRVLEKNPEARKAFEEGQRQKDQQAQPVKKAAEAAEAEAAKKEQAPKPAAPAAAARADLAPAAERYDWRKSPYVGNLFLKRLADNEAVTLTHFGHDLFVPTPGAAQLLENVPVSSGYLVGPGDEIVVRMWGRVEGTQRMVVDRDGKIFFPKFGSLYVAGKTFDELKSFLRGKVSTIAEVSSDVSMGQLKGIRVSVVGEVRSPGWYNVSSLHTALQALSVANGMKDIGSLRSVRINRGGKTAQEIDLYDLLLSGDTRADLRILQDDVIFIPVVGRLVAVVGEVRRPAIYELKNEKNLLDVIRLAGGFAPSAFKRRVQVERLEGHYARVVLDIDTEELESGRKSFDLSDGDIVRVLPIAVADMNAVTLEGNVLRPGKYERKPGMTVGTLLPDADAFLPDTYFDYALLTRRVPPDQHKEVIHVNLREIVLERKPGADLALEPRDTIRVFPRSAFRDHPRASISGEVRMIRREGLRPAPVLPVFPVSPVSPVSPASPVSPGSPVSPAFPVSPAAQDNQAMQAMGKGTAGTPPTDNAVFPGTGPDASRTAVEPLTFEIQAGARVADLVKLAGGLTRLAYLERAEIVRVDDARNFRTIYFHLGKAMAGDPQENPLLENEDHVRIHSVWETKYRKTVTVIGEVNAPGEYLLTDGMKLSDLIFKAGGMKEGAFLREAELIRREVTAQGDLVKTETVVVFPEKVLAGEPGTNLPLRVFDILAVRQIPDWGEKIQVAMAGEVRFPGMYAVRKGERLSSVIQRAGGFTQDAYLRGAQFTRVSTQRSQQEAIDKLIEELELEVAQKAQQVSGAIDREDVEASRELWAARRALIAQLKKTKAKGRVIIRLADGNIAGTPFDLALEDGDALDVPKKMSVVNVVGRVYNPTAVVFNPAKDTVGYNLDMVGGPTSSADTDHIFVLRVDGSVFSRDNVGGIFSGGLLSAKVEPGDTIMVPEKLIQVRAMKDVKDITQILMQIAVTVGVLIALF